jgi:acyl-coenzyme A synthetase/AMP-(fatty) acid ligase
VFPDVDVEIVDQSGNILPVGREGFVRLRSPQFLKGLDEETSASWFYPGDLGSLTEDGILCIAGRTGDVVNRGGVKLSTAEFESFMSSFTGVKDAGVCTVMGAAGHENIWVGVVVDPSIDIGAFRHHIESNSHFASNIDKLFVVESIPRNVLGKVQQSQLKEMLQGIDQGAPAPP